MRAALCVICHDRPDELKLLLASAAGEPWAEVVIVDMASEPALVPVMGTTWVRSDVNGGVTRGRNMLARAATADILFFLDDDAILASADAVDRVTALMAEDDNVAVVAFRLIRRGGEMRKDEFPFRGRVRDPYRGRDCAYFLGTAHAIKREAMLQAGGYDETFFYSTEEIDMAMRLIRTGKRIVYDPDIVVEHRPSSRGREVMPRVPALRLRNRLIYARRHLPPVVDSIHIVVWAGRTALEARRAGGLRQWFEGLREGLTTEVDRSPLGFRAALRAHRLGGRVLW